MLTVSFRIVFIVSRLLPHSETPARFYTAHQLKNLKGDKNLLASTMSFCEEVNLTTLPKNSSDVPPPYPMVVSKKTYTKLQCPRHNFRTGLFSDGPRMMGIRNPEPHTTEANAQNQQLQLSQFYLIHFRFFSPLRRLFIFCDIKKKAFF